MSRIGKKPLVIPEKVKLEVKGSQVEISGPLGKLTQNIPNGLQVSVAGTTALVELKNGVTKDEAGHLHGLTRTIIQNSIQGVTQGFKRDLFVVGLGYRGQVTGDKLTLTLGFSHPVEFKIPQGIKAVVVDAKQTVGGVPAFTLTLSGTDKILLGEVAASIRRLKKPEPYKGGGIRYSDEQVARKAGKAAAGAVGGGGKK